jgi:hypothetical protein
MRSEVDKLARDSRDPYMERVSNFLREIEDDIAVQAEKAVGSTKGLAKKAKSEYSDLKEVERLVKNQPKDKADPVASTAMRAGVYGAARGDVTNMATAAGISAVDFLVKHKDQFVASNIGGLLKNIKGNTKWAETFKRAIEKSGETGSGVAAAHYQLSSTDPEYRKAAKAARDKDKENN